MQRTTGWVALLSIPLLFLLGCIEEELPAGPPPEAPAPAAEARPDPHAFQPAPLPARAEVLRRADRLMIRLVDAVNSGNSVELARLASVPPEEPDPSAATAALDDYRRFFGREPITEHRLVGEVGDDPSTGSDMVLGYQIAAEGGPSKRVRVHYDARLDTLRVDDEFLTYSWEVRGFVTSILEAIHREDEAVLSSLLFGTDPPPPAGVVRRALVHYDERYDVSTLRAAFVGLDAHDPGSAADFIFEMRGERDGRTLHHTIHVVVEAGLLRWEDPLVPRRGGV